MNWKKPLKFSEVKQTEILYLSLINLLFWKIEEENFFVTSLSTSLINMDMFLFLLICFMSILLVKKGHNITLHLIFKNIPIL